jgi:ATP-dependent Clp protease ATP-binding subunit ClpB
MTSNIASEYLLNTEHEMVDEEVIQKELQRHFRPELLNRIDSIITFNSLSKEVIMEIIDRQLTLLQNKLMSEQDYQIKFTEASIKKIVDEGYDKQFGARPIKRYIEKNIETMIAMAIIKNELEKNKTYVIDVKNDEFVFASANKLN